MIKTFRDLIVWQKAVQFVSQLYEVSQCFPKHEIYGLTAQIRRSAVSIPSNIAEGYGRRSTGDYVRFLQISVGSVYELETQLEIAKNLHYLEEQPYTTLYDSIREIERMLVALINSLNP